MPGSLDLAPSNRRPKRWDNIGDPMESTLGKKIGRGLVTRKVG